MNAHVRVIAALADRFGDDLHACTGVKDHACDLILVAAEDWTAGQPGR